MKSKMHIVLADIHYPEHARSALSAVWSFMRHHKASISSVTLLGDALDCENLSHHTKGKPGLRKRGGYKSDMDGFSKDILSVIESIVTPETTRTYMFGNHERFIEDDLINEMPELDGVVNIPVMLNLKGRGWRYVKVGDHTTIGKVILMHGDQIGSNIHIAKKMLDQLMKSCVMGHVHRSSSFSASALVTEKKKLIGHTLGCLCTLSPGYAKGRPNAFVHGFGVLEQHGDFVNIHNIIIMPDGTFSYGGRVFGGAR